MNNRKYQKLVNQMTPKENNLSNLLISFFIGGIIGIIGQILYDFFIQMYSSELSISFMLLVLIIISSLITSLSFGDSLFMKFKCGLIIPITGFAHSIASSIIDFKKEGLLNVGSNAFKLAGSVILYGIVSAVLLTCLKVMLNV